MLSTSSNKLEKDKPVRSTSSNKLEKFKGEVIGDKPVTEIAGVGADR